MATKKSVKAKTPKFKFVKPGKKVNEKGRPRVYAYDLKEIVKYLKKDKTHGSKKRAAEKFGIPYVLLTVQLGRMQGKYKS